MTVKQLIETLKLLPDSLEVVFADYLPVQSVVHEIDPRVNREVIIVSDEEV